jgi:hypothetical protein
MYPFFFVHVLTVKYKVIVAIITKDDKKQDTQQQHKKQANKQAPKEQIKNK